MTNRDSSKIADAALGLLYLTLHDETRAWKTLDWDLLDQLHASGYIEVPRNKAKSIQFTDQGLRRAKVMVESLSCSESGGQTSAEFQYGEAVASVAPAAGARGVLCRSVVGNGYFLRVTQPDGSFIDYELRHSDLSITIDHDDEASFYTLGDDHILDHSPQTLGLKKVER